LSGLLSYHGRLFFANGLSSMDQDILVKLGTSGGAGEWISWKGVFENQVAFLAKIKNIMNNLFLFILHFL